MTNNFAFEVKVDLCLKYTFTGGGWGWLDKSIIMLISAPVGFELGLGAELGKTKVEIYYLIEQHLRLTIIDDA